MNPALVSFVGRSVQNGLQTPFISSRQNAPGSASFSQMMTASSSE